MLARIRLGDRIGRGGMAEVFAAQLVGPAGFEKDVAVKRILPRYAHDPVFLERFLNEARLAARLSHPNIVQIFELGHDGNDHYIVMEAVRGKSLRTIHDRLRDVQATFPREVALHVALGLCAGLAHADEQLGLIHRDVSPHNVLLSFDGAVKLIDFGIARVRSEDRLTQVGRVLGKLRYLSPEQLLDDEIDARADVFATGVVLFEMLTSRLPFDGKSEQEIGERIRDGVRPDIRALVPDLQQQIVDVIDQALAIDRKKRFQSAREMGAALAVASLSLPNGPHDVEALMRRLYPDEVSRAWPVTGDVRNDGAEHTKTQAPHEITISSNVESLSEGSAAFHEAVDDPTLDTERPRSRRALLLVAASAAATTAIGGFAVFRARAGTADPPPSPKLVVIDEIVDAGAQSDAGFEEPVVVDAGQLEEEPAPQRKKRLRVRTGRLVVETRPWTRVKIDGRNAGVTPLAVELTAGSHKILLENSESGVRRELDVRIPADETTTLRLDLRK